MLPQTIGDLMQFQTQKLRTTVAVSSCRKPTLTWKWTLRWVWIQLEIIATKCCWWGRFLAQSPHKNIPSESRGPAGLRAAGGQDPAENQAGGDPDTGETGLVHLKCGLVRLVHIFIMLPFKVVERRKQIEIEEQEIKRKEKELIATVKLELIRVYSSCKAWPVISSRLGGCSSTW